MSSKILLISIFFFLFFAGSAQAVETNQDNSEFELCLDFVNSHPDYKLTVMSTDHLFKNNNYYYATKIDNNHLYYYSAISGNVNKLNPDSDMYIHVFEHGEEKRTWKWLTDNCFPYW